MTLAVGVEITADRMRTVIVVAALTAPRMVDVELQPVLEGTDGVAALLELWRTFDLVAIAVDPRSHAATLVEPLRAEGMPVALPDAAALAGAHGVFIDLMRGRRLRHHNQPALTAALAAAHPRPLAGAVALRRGSGTVDPAPAVAAELAVWALGDLDHPDGIEPGAWVI